jgi:hypothetical protein
MVKTGERMKILKFNECNTTYAKDQPEYLQLPAFRARDGRVATLWGLSFKDRIKVLFTGKIWLEVLTFNKPLLPLKVSADKPDMRD